MSIKNLTQHLLGMVEASVKKHSHSEDVIYDLFWMIDPQTQGFNAYFLVAIPSIMIGQYLSAFMTVPYNNTLVLDEEGVDTLIREGIENARQERSKTAEGEYLNPAQGLD